MTTTISWNLIAGYYHGLPWYGTGIMTAAEPWSGSFDTSNVGLIWGSAHTTQFAQPGWFVHFDFFRRFFLNLSRQYLSQGEGSGFLLNGGSYVTLTDGTDFSIVIEKMSWDHSQWFDFLFFA